MEGLGRPAGRLVDMAYQTAQAALEVAGRATAGYEDATAWSVDLQGRCNGSSSSSDDVVRFARSEAPFRGEILEQALIWGSSSSGHKQNVGLSDRTI